jgi:hypothetical protein
MGYLKKSEVKLRGNFLFKISPKIDISQAPLQALIVILNLAQD